MDALDERIVKLERPVGFSVLAALLSFTAIGTVLFWALFPTNGIGMDRSSVYLAWKRPFPLAEAWMALTAIAAAIGLLRMKDWGLLFGCLAGSALVFLGLANVLFFMQNNLYTPPHADTIIQVVIHLWSLTFGPFVIAYLWGKRRWFFWT
jgi:hypothetical protein